MLEETETRELAPKVWWEWEDVSEREAIERVWDGDLSLSRVDGGLFG